jgi:multiple sugar transport system permease protein
MKLAASIGARFYLRKSSNDIFTGYLYLIPSIIVVLLTFAYPMIRGVIQSFYTWDPLIDGEIQKFVFLQNYEEVLNDPLFYKALWKSLVLTIAGVGIEFVLGLLVAQLIYENIRFKNYIKTAVIIPMMVAPILGGLIWKMFVDYTFGLFNHILRMLSIPPVNWIGSERWVLPTIIFVEVWQNTSFVILVLLAGLQAIPLEQFEAAEVDGATKWQKLIHITLPWLRPLILIVILFRTLFIFRTFDTVFLLVGSTGGAGNSAMVLGLYLYHSAFHVLRFGLASSISVILLFLTAVLSISSAIFLYRTLKV